MEQTCVEAQPHVEELLNEVPAMNSEVNNSESLVQRVVQPLESTSTPSCTLVAQRRTPTIK